MVIVKMLYFDPVLRLTFPDFALVLFLRSRILQIGLYLVLYLELKVSWSHDATFLQRYLLTQRLPIFLHQLFFS